MSLLKQLLLSVTVAIVAILVGTLAFSIGSARDYLDTQVQSESENAAVSLAITLSQPANQDTVIRELLLMAAYDTGRFQALRFAEPGGDVVFERQRSALGEAAGVPEWFRSFLPLQTPVATREVSDGWKQVGRLTVVGENGYAYASLWKNVLSQLLLVLLAGLAWAIVVILLMRWLKRALNDQVTRQVRAIAGGEELPASTHTPVRELSGLVNEITQVRDQVRANVYEMDAKIESLKLELHQDAVTGLANRKYFTNELRRLLHDAAAKPGHLMLLRIRDLAGINATHSRQEVDNWLRRVAQTMRQVAETETSQAQVARLNGSDFAILIPELDGPQAIHFAQAVSAQLRPLRLSVMNGGQSRWAFSLTDYVAGQEAGAILSLLDYGLMRAESAGADEVEYLPGEHGAGSRMTASESQWRELLHEGLDTEGLRLNITPVVYEGATQWRCSEATLQLRDGDEWLSGALFMPVAARLNLSAECDLRAIDLGIEWIQQHQQDLILRVSLPSLMQTRFWTPLRTRMEALAAQPDIARHLVLELDAHGLVACAEATRHLVDLTQKAGVRVGIRRLDAEPAALTAMHTVPVKYVRITGALIDSLAEGVGGRELLKAIAATAKPLNLNVLADSPATEAGVAHLQELNIMVARG